MRFFHARQPAPPLLTPAALGRGLDARRKAREQGFGGRLCRVLCLAALAGAGGLARILASPRLSGYSELPLLTSGLGGVAWRIELLARSAIILLPAAASDNLCQAPGSRVVETAECGEVSAVQQGTLPPPTSSSSNDSITTQRRGTQIVDSGV